MPFSFEKSQAINEEISRVFRKIAGEDHPGYKLGDAQSEEFWERAKKVVLADEIRACKNFESLRDLLSEIYSGNFDNSYAIYTGDDV